MTALFIQTPLEFSAFPTVLLISTMLRLALNLASTRLILAHGHEGTAAAGHVIEAFGNFVMGGNFVIGVIVFAILVIVNFVVITKGSGRIAEVAARFNLDAMPGKQMAIDADLSAGLINENEARTRRKDLEDESAFFGAMDGASKFVRGDAIAGLLIVFINVIGGMIIGIAQQGMPFADAARTYTLLTVGDGLVTQIPALIVSTAAGLLVSKAGVSRRRRQGADDAVLRLSEGARHVGGRHGRDGAAAGHSDAAVPALGGGAGALAFVIDKRTKQAPRSPTRSRRAAQPPPRPSAEEPISRRAQDRRSQDRARLCAAAAGQLTRRHRPPHRADQGAAPLARGRDGLRDAGRCASSTTCSSTPTLRHQAQGSGCRQRPHLARASTWSWTRPARRCTCPACTRPSRPSACPPPGSTPRSRKRRRSRATPWSMPRRCCRPT